MGCNVPFTRETACLVINLVKANNFAVYFKCPAVGQTQWPPLVATLPIRGRARYGFYW